jgi:hypothetical protein
MSTRNYLLIILTRFFEVNFQKTKSSSIFLVLIFMFLVIGCRNISDGQAGNQFFNTVWVAKIASNCMDTLKFRPNEQVYSYSCEIDYSSNGTYSFEGGAVILLIIEDSREAGEMWRYRFIRKNDSLLPISSDKLELGKWQNVKSVFDSSYVFTKLN